MASMEMEKMWILISASIYLVSYIIFVGLFGAIMFQINMHNSDLDNKCPEVKKKLRRSGDEFIAYSICGFVLIGTSIIFTLASLVLL